LSHGNRSHKIRMSHHMVSRISQHVTDMYESAISNQYQSADHKSDMVVQGSVGPRPIMREAWTD
jgi:hypothetical protein